MVKLKNGVTGFIYDSVYGYVKIIFGQPLTENEIKSIERVLSEDDVLFTSNDSLNDMFEFECKEDLERDVEGLNEVLEWVE
jgi:hypothetical protein